MPWLGSQQLLIIPRKHYANPYQPNRYIEINHSLKCFFSQGTCRPYLTAFTKRQQQQAMSNKLRPLPTLNSATNRTNSSVNYHTKESETPALFPPMLNQITSTPFTLAGAAAVYPVAIATLRLGVGRIVP